MHPLCCEGLELARRARNNRAAAVHWRTSALSPRSASLSAPLERPSALLPIPARYPRPNRPELPATFSPEQTCNASSKRTSRPCPILTKERYCLFQRCRREPPPRPRRGHACAAQPPFIGYPLPHAPSKLNKCSSAFFCARPVLLHTLTILFDISPRPGLGPDPTPCCSLPLARPPARWVCHVVFLSTPPTVYLPC